MSEIPERRRLRRRDKQVLTAATTVVPSESPEVAQPRRADKAVRKELRKTSLASVTSLQSLLQHLEIPSTDWDYLIVGDGSGTTWDKEFGWGSVLIAKGDGSRMPFYGGMSNGTNNMAEILTVLHPLMYLANKDLGAKTDGTKVQVISDSQYVVEGLKQDNPIWVSKLSVNRELWMAIHMTRRRGLIIKSHHIPRDTIDLNKLGHDLANISRKRMIGILSELPHDVYKSNPFETIGV